MKRMIFLSSLDISSNRTLYDGVTKKELLEIETFQNMGFIVDYIYKLEYNYYLKNGEDNTSHFLTNSENRFYKDIKKIYTNLPNLINKYKYDNLYLRMEGLSYNLYNFLWQLKKKNPGITIYGEQPTVQKKWDEDTPFKSKIRFILKETKNHLFSSPIDKVVTFDNSNKLYRRETIKIENFVNVENYPIKNNWDNEHIYLLGLAMMHPCHGYDRIIKGLKEYYKVQRNRKVYFVIIGDGRVKNNWENMTKEYNLTKYIKFVGKKSQEEIDEYVEKSNIAVASLACFRKKCTKPSEIKIREFCARGIPFVYSALEPSIEDKEWCLKVPFDETPINIEDIINFVDSLNYNTISKEMRQFALQNCQASFQLSKIFLDESK